MVLTPPVSQPLPAAAVVAPAPVQKMARSQHRVRTETVSAVDASERGERTTQARRPRRPRGETVDLLA